AIRIAATDRVSDFRGEFSAATLVFHNQPATETGGTGGNRRDIVAIHSGIELRPVIPPHPCRRGALRQPRRDDTRGGIGQLNIGKTEKTNVVPVTGGLGEQRLVQPAGRQCVNEHDPLLPMVNSELPAPGLLPGLRRAVPGSVPRRQKTLPFYRTGGRLSCSPG